MKIILQVPGNKVCNGLTDPLINLYIPADKACHISGQLGSVTLDGIFNAAFAEISIAVTIFTFSARGIVKVPGPAPISKTSKSELNKPDRFFTASLPYS